MSIDSPAATSVCPSAVHALQLYGNAVSCLRTPIVQMGGPEMLTHHIAAFLSVALASYTGQAHLYTLLLLSTELTTPFVNARWIYDQMVRPSMFNLVGTHKFEGCMQSSANMQTYAPRHTRDTFVSSRHEVGVMLCRGGGQHVSTK